MWAGVARSLLVLGSSPVAHSERRSRGLTSRSASPSPDPNSDPNPNPDPNANPSLGAQEVPWRTASVEPPHEARQVQDGPDDDRAAAEAAHRRPHEPGAEGDDHFERVRHRPGLLALAAAPGVAAPTRRRRVGKNTYGVHVCAAKLPGRTQLDCQRQTRFALGLSVAADPRAQ